MDVIWDRGEATVREVCDTLTRPLAYTTVMTTMRLLAGRKKVLRRSKRGRAHVYRPCISREAVSRSMLSEIRELLFGGSTTSLVLNALSDQPLSAADRQALREALQQVEQQ
jgi:predicted transcriptional regulator